MRQSQPGDSLVMIVMSLSPDGVEDVQALLDLVHEGVDGLNE